MKVIEPSFERIDRKGMTPYQFLEKIGRTCYKSEDKITEDSSVKFASHLMKRGHYSILEHYWLHIKFDGYDDKLLNQLKYLSLSINRSVDELLWFVEVSNVHDVFISCPLRAILDITDEIVRISGQNDLKNYPLVDELLSCVSTAFPEIFERFLPFVGFKKFYHFTLMDEESFLEELSEQVIDRYGRSSILRNEVSRHRTLTVKLTCDRGVTHELVRHRPASYAQESTRYCNYSKGQFGGELTFIKPCFFEEGSDLYVDWKSTMTIAEKNYLEMIEKGAKPEEARTVLPNSLKADIIVTANYKEWQHIFNMRVKGTGGKPHPQIKEVLEPLYLEEKAKSFVI